MKVIPYHESLKELKALKSQTKLKPVPEKLVISACIKWLWNHKCFVWRNNTGHWKDGNGNHIRYGYVGSADIIGINPHGVFLAIECKSGYNKQTEEQLNFQRKVEEQKGIYILAYSVDDLIAMKQRILSL